MPTIDFDSLTERDIAKTIDHSLLRPELDDALVEDGCRLAAEYDVASVCVRPVDVGRAGVQGAPWGKREPAVSAAPPHGQVGVRCGP